MADKPTHSKILILDFGSQYTQVIARRIRECQVYSEIIRFDTPAAEVAALKPNGLILSGGPASVYDKDAPQIEPEIFCNLLHGPGAIELRAELGLIRSQLQLLDAIEAFSRVSRDRRWIETSWLRRVLDETQSL